MKLIKLNNTQANKITGIYDKIYAIDPIHIEDNFWVVKIGKDFNEKYGILKRHLNMDYHMLFQQIRQFQNIILLILFKDHHISRMNMNIIMELIH